MRTWQRVLAAIAVAAVAAVVLGLVVRALSSSESGPGPAGEASVEAQTSIAPRELHFGDLLEATVVVTVDRSRVDPGSVTVTPAFEAYRPLGPPRRTRSDGGRMTTLTATYRLLCLTGRCTPTQDVLHEQFEPVSIGYRDTVTGETATVEAPWQSFLVRTRLDARIAQDQLQPDGTFVNSSPWRARLTSLPPAGYRVSPAWATRALLAIGLVLVGGAAVLLFLALPRWAPKAEPEPEPEPEPDPVPPLEQALQVLESPVEANGASGRRRALELVADAAGSWGETGLAHAARTLAWSEDAPQAADTQRLAARVRARLAEEREQAEQGEHEERQEEAGGVVA